VFQEPCHQSNSSRKQDPAVDCFYSAAAHRSRGALWPSFALARIEPDRDSRVRQVMFPDLRPRKKLHLPRFQDPPVTIVPAAQQLSDNGYGGARDCSN